jgi:hypothetical protein
VTSAGSTVAGRRRAPATAALLAALLGAASALAHGPITKTYREAPPGTPMPPTPPVTAADLAQTPAVSAATRPLRVLADEATAVATVDVARTEVFDEGRLHAYRLHVVRVLRGRLDDAEPAVVDIRADPKGRPLLDDGTRVVVFLKPAPAYSYLTAHLPAGLTPFVLVAGREGLVPVGGDAGREPVERAIEQGMAVAGMAENDALVARRRLAFSELAGANGRLLADGVAELGLLPALTPVSSEEMATLTRVLADPRIDPQARIGLAGVLADRGATACVPALAGAATDTPAVLDAILAARARLGALPTRAELDVLLGRDDAGVRAAAVRALAKLDDPAAIADVGHYATTDQDPAVRGAAVDALGETHRASVLPVLEHTFQDTSRDVMQRSARAMIAIGGRDADDTLTGIALHASAPDIRRYAALILIVTHGRNDPVVQQLAASNPSPEVRAVLDHPLEFNHMHVKD